MKYKEKKTLCKYDPRLRNDDQHNKEDLKWKKAIVCHKSTSDGGAIAMMCEKDEKPPLSVVAHWKITMTRAHYRAMDTCC
jgi:hypothetical protein